MNFEFRSNLFVRINIVNNILENIERGKSTKLLGIEGIGMSFALKALHNFCISRSAFNDFCASFFFSNDYDFDSFKYRIKSQMKTYGFENYNIRSDNLMIICNDLADVLIPPGSKRKLVFLFDNFQYSFSKDPKLRDTTNTMLVKFNIDKMRAIGDEDDSKTVFVATYRYPVSQYLSTIWYLNNFQTVEVGLLTEEEEEKLIRVRRDSCGFFDLNKMNEAIRYYGGKHPTLLDHAATTNFNDINEVNKLEEWILRKYIMIERDFEKFGPKPQDPNSYVNLLKKVATNKAFNKNHLPELPKQYCFLEKKVNNNKIEVRVFSKHFEDYLLKKRNEEINQITWLHLSDLHYYKEKTGWDAEHVLETLIADLKELEEKHHLSPCMLFFTGDLAFGQVDDKGGSLEEQYEGVHDFVEKVRNAFTEPIPKEMVFLVPGNHDVNCKKVSTATKRMFENDISEEEVSEMIRTINLDWEHSFIRMEDYRKYFL